MPAILVVDDEQSVRASLSMLLRSRNYHVETVADGHEALSRLRSHPFNVMIVDLKMEQMDGLELLRQAGKTCPFLETIVLTGYGTVESAVEAIKMGAFDYVSKPVDTQKLLVIVRNALEKQALRGELNALRSRFKKKACLRAIIGRNRAMRDVIATVTQVAGTDSTVLITGETGTGKQLIANALHNLSDRSGKPFIGINCSALPEELIESELFGHVKGAFTGAVGTKKGLFEFADGGTIFLDDISATTLRCQGKLLNAIEEKKIRMVGSNQMIGVDVRVVAATNRYLPALIERGQFRNDLYFRLNLVPLFLPPLRQRVDDIPLLTGHFLGIYCRKHGKGVVRISARARKMLMNYQWPGNVRELEHVIERAVLFSRGGELTEADFPFLGEHDGAGCAGENAVGRGLTLKELERLHIVRVLERHLGNKSSSAKELGISRNTLDQKIKKYGV